MKFKINRDKENILQWGGGDRNRLNRMAFLAMLEAEDSGTRPSKF